MTRLKALTVAVVTLASFSGGSWQGLATPVSDSALEYSTCARVFPDPHAYWPSPSQVPSRSPLAKGNASCAAADFLSYEEMIAGVEFLETLFPEFVEFYKLEQDFGDGSNCSESTSSQDFCSSGLPRQGTSGGERIKSDLYLLRITDERTDLANKKFFAFPLSIHGIERAGAEGGVRAAEDLATWAWCEAKSRGENLSAPGGGAAVDCAREGAPAHPILETRPGDSITAGQALKRAAVYFLFPNPDGWRRGDPDNLARFYQRYNGNGVDLNRDWPTLGYTFRPYTPWSEPETRSFGKVLKQIRNQWDGGIDLHGQVIDRAFSFTLLGASERDFGKNQAMLQIVKGAWEDAEKRLSWSPLIIPNDADQQCISSPEGTACDKMYGVQWGTVWDTIDYTTTGSFGDWIDSPLGLDAVGIDNEMSFSHLSNCGSGACYLTDFEQLHIDGNKSLIYGMIHFSLISEDTKFRASGKVGYVYNPKRIFNTGHFVGHVASAGLAPQGQILDRSLSAANDFTYEFEVQGPSAGVYNGGLEGKATPNAQLQGTSATGFVSIVLEKLLAAEENPAEANSCGMSGDQWTEVNRYYNQGVGPIPYFQSGQAVHANSPDPGKYRICVDMSQDLLPLNQGVTWDLDITFSTEKAWEDPGQLPYSVSNMQFFVDLAKYMEPGQLIALNVDDILRGKVNLRQFTSIVVADDPLPGYAEPAPSGPAQPNQVFDPPTAANTTVPCGHDPRLEVSEPPSSCVANYEFDILPSYNNQTLTVRLEHDGGFNLRLDRRSDTAGTWTQEAFSATYSGSEEIKVAGPRSGHYRARIVNFGGAQAQKLEINFSNAYTGAAVQPSVRSMRDVSKWGSALLKFVDEGGNLVLTDGALKNLAYMGIVPRSAVSQSHFYAGFVWFTRDTKTSTYSDALGAAVDQPGSAEGPNFRHQTYEPIPIGYEIPDEIGTFQGTAPVWTVDQPTWEKAGGRTAGSAGNDQVVLGELRRGSGAVRVLGAILPMPSDAYDHPFGLANYSVTYSGYQVMSNLLQWHPSDLAATGSSPSEDATLFAGLVLLLIGLRVLGGIRRRPS